MGFDFNPTIWFVCRLCRQGFPTIDKLKDHKLENHLGDCLKIKCIVFEEKFVDCGWTPAIPSQYSSNESLLADTSKQSQCQDQLFHSERVEKFQNPRVSLTKLKPQNINSIVNNESSGRNDSIASDPVIDRTNITAPSSRCSSSHTNANVDVNITNKTHSEDQYQPEESGNSSPNTDVECISDGLDFDALSSDDEDEDPSFYSSHKFLELEYHNEEDHPAGSSQDNGSMSTAEENDNETPVQKKKMKKKEEERVPQVGSKFQCTVGSCSSLFNSLNSLWRHKRNKHFKELGTPAYSCPFPTCTLTFGFKYSFTDHLRTHRKEAGDIELEEIISKYSTNDEKQKQRRAKLAAKAMHRNSLLDGEVDVDLDLGLCDWLVLQKEKDPSNIIAIEPDPTSTSIDTDTDAGHFQGVSEDQSVKCLLCQESLTSEASLRNHVLMCWNHNKKRHRYCYLCSKTFTFNRYLKSHNEVHHPTVPGAPRPKFRCSRCPKEFLGRYARKLHEDIHDLDPNNVVKDFLCPTCGAMFRTKNYLGAHMLKHSTQKPWKCTEDGCNMAFKQRCLLQRHVGRFHAAPSFTCSFCGKLFKTAFTLRVHERTHTGDLPFKCDMCDKAFATQAPMINHRLGSHRLELGLPELICPLSSCGQTFCSSSSMNRHIQRKQHGQVLTD